MYPSLTRFPGDLFAHLEELQRQLEQRVGARGGASSIRAVDRGSFPAINVGTTDTALEIYAFAPGVDPATVEVSVDKGLLRISGTRATEMPPENEKVTVYATERFSGRFKRVVSLPEDADGAKVEASCRDGVLRILVPKREAIRPRRVEIKEQA
jgi:HSP20 family protein